MTSRLFSALLIGLAMMLAPLGMPAMAEATPPADHHGQMVQKDHCKDEPAPADDGKAADKGCCAATCHGTVTAPAAYAEMPEISGLALRPAMAPFRRGTPMELPTPPPRLA